MFYSLWFIFIRLFLYLFLLCKKSVVKTICIYNVFFGFIRVILYFKCFSVNLLYKISRIFIIKMASKSFCKPIYLISFTYYIIVAYSSPFSLSALSAVISPSIISSISPFKKFSIWKILIPILWSVILPWG